MKKKFAAFILCVLCLLSAVGCGQAKTDEQTPPTDQSAVTDDYLTTISGTYVELFPELSKSEYRNIWIEATTPLAGAENAETATDMLLGMCMAEPYGPEAAEKYAADPDSMAFNCYFLGGVDKFVMDGHTITGLDAQGQEVFSHTYKLLDEENENGFMLKFYGDDVRNRAIAKAAAGSDARMSGCELPVVINSGSGNQGITVSVPVIEYAKALAVPKDRLYRALALSNLIAIHEKTGIGRLSAYCGAVSAGCAAGCGIAYLQGADLKAISHTLVNSLAIVSGIICDGAKPSCAAKIASSVQAGIMGYHMYQNGQQFRGGDGIVTKGVENTIRNVSQLGREGMRETDKEIVKIMLQES